MREKIRTFRDDRMRLGEKIKRVCFFCARLFLSLKKTGCGSAKKSNEFVFLHLPFAVFEEDKMRLGRVKL